MKNEKTSRRSTEPRSQSVRRTPGARNGRAHREQVIARFEPLTKTRTRSLAVRVVEWRVRPGRRLDIREFVTGAGYKGPTKRGIRLDLTMFRALVKQAPAIKRVLRGLPATPAVGTPTERRRSDGAA